MFKKRLLAVSLMLVTTSLVVGCKEDAKKEESAALDTLEQKASYIIGLNIGNNLKANGFDVQADQVALALRDLQAGTESRINEEEFQTIMQEVQEKAMAKHSEEQKRLTDENTAKGKTFLDENKAKEGVVTTESGLQYRVITEGTGEKPAATDTVTVHYTGKLIDGTEFDSSVKHGQPATFPLDGVIPGWTEALQLMPQGSKWEIVIPSDLAYGASGQGPIPPASTLVFEVELLEIVKPEAAAE
jgi:FKBP-type peptidyl-prolyl cis-trans isomerase FkpA